MAGTPVNDAAGSLADSLAGRSCVVLGGGGFIGTHLCRTLVRRGAKVQAFGRSRSFPEACDGVSWISGGFSDHAAMARAIEGNEVVFHLIGGNTPASSNMDPAADLATSAINTIHMLDLCRAAGVRKVIFVSSGGTVYGAPNCAPIPESAPTNPISAYGVSKLTVEKYLGLYRHLHGVEYSALRVANPFGPFQTALKKQGVIAAIIERALAGEPVEVWGTGEVVRDFIHVADVVEALIAVVDYNGPHHVFNVGCGVGRSVNQIIADIGTVIGRGPIPTIYKPARQADAPVNVLDIALIQRETGWRPRVEWMDGLRETLQWIDAQLYRQPKRS